MGMRGWLAALALLAVPVLAAPAMAQVRSVDLFAPRPFGHVIGDTLALQAHIVLDAPFTLDPAALPSPRPVNYWLDLRKADLKDHGVRDGQHRYTLDLLYQTFYAPLEPRRLDIPALALSAVDGERRVSVNVPAWSFLSSPLREVVSSAPGQAMALRPDLLPRPVATTGMARALAGFVALIVIGLALLAWQMAWWPFGIRRSRPFARAARSVSTLLRAPSETAEGGYRGALLALHRAFDATAGRGLFAEDLPGFFSAHPTFRSLETEVRRLFAASRELFFGGDPAGARRELPPGELVDLARRLRGAEREAA